jgi:hypothetical protein
MASATGVSSSEMAVDHATGPGAVEKPRFDALTPNEMSGGRPQFRKVPMPQHRFAPLKRCWMEIYKPVYEHMKIDIRMNLKVRGELSLKFILVKAARFILFQLGCRCLGVLASVVRSWIH